MAIIIRLDRVMADRKMSLNELADKVGLTNVNMSNLKTGKMKGIRSGLSARRHHGIHTR